MDPLETIERLQDLRRKEIMESWETSRKEKFIKRAGKHGAQMVGNLGLTWKYDEKKGMIVTTSLGISMRETENGLSDFDLLDFTYKGKSYDGRAIDDIDTLLAIFKLILQENET